jgi:hypothetical protein
VAGGIDGIITGEAPEWIARYPRSRAEPPA